MDSSADQSNKDVLKLRRKETQGCVTRDDIEVSVCVQDLRLMANRDSSDETVGQLTEGLAVLAADAMKLSGLLIV